MRPAMIVKLNLVLKVKRTQTQPGKVKDSKPIHLRLSAGGYALQFSMTSSENIDSFGYEWSISAEASVSRSDSQA